MNGQIAQLFRKQKVENLRAKAQLAGITNYFESPRTDGDKGFKIAVDYFVEEAKRVREVRRRASPESVAYLDVKFIGCLEGVRDAAMKSGNKSDASYVSKAIKKLQV